MSKHREVLLIVGFLVCCFLWRNVADKSLLVSQVTIFDGLKIGGEILLSQCSLVVVGDQALVVVVHWRVVFNRID